MPLFYKFQREIILLNHLYVLSFCFVGRGHGGRNYLVINTIECPIDQNPGTLVKSMV